MPRSDSVTWCELPPLRGATACVIGLGRFGGSLGAIRWLAAQGAHVVVTDRAPAARLSDSLAEIQPLIAAGKVECLLGQQSAEDVRGATIVVASAAVPTPWQNSLLIAARDGGAVVTTEIALALRALEDVKAVAVTGSAGKSTTTTLLHRALDGGGLRTWLGGNIGGSLLDSLAQGVELPEWLVLELSSAQLWWLSDEALRWGGMGAGRWMPDVGVLTNLAPNHVDWHGSVEHYIASKAGIVPRDGVGALLSAQERVQTATLCRSDSIARWWPQDPSPRDTPPPLLLPGAHNRHNAALAMTAARRVVELSQSPQSFSMQAARDAISSFAGLPHRLELIGEFGGRRCFNDSKSTTPGSTRLAIAAFPDPGRIHLIAGGYDKGVDLTPLREVAPQLAGLYAIGQTGPSIALDEPWSRCDILSRAVETAFARSHAGDIILLSPGCASWDQFPDFQERGLAFAAACRSCGGGARSADTIHA